MKKILLYKMPGFEELSETLAGELDIKKGSYQLKRFTNNEAQIVINDDVKDSECLVLGTNAPPDQRMIELLFLCHTLKKQGAKKISALLPYLAYTRQDKKEAQKGLAMDWFAKTFKISGISEVITLDIHSQLAKKLFKIPLVSLSPAKIFTDEIKRISFADATIVAPDEGAINRCQEVKKYLGIEEPISYFQKKRNGQTILAVFKGKIGKRVILVDDILDTGGTLIVACQELKKLGGPEIIIMVTHGLFTNDNWKELWNLGVKKIYTTDTLPEVKTMISSGISILPIAPVIEKYLKS
jgi:ribose-phosphate pyrophosphokinase